MSDPGASRDDGGMKPTVERDAQGQEAPMVIGPRSLVRLVKQIVGVFRGSDPRREA